jgi:hypothetical protein
MNRYVMSILVVAALVGNTAFAEIVPAGQSNVIPRGTTLRLILEDRLDSEDAMEGDAFSANLAEDLVIDGRLMIRRGAVVTGTISQVEDADRLAGLTGKASMTLRFDRIRANGEWRPLSATLVSVHDPLEGVGADDYFGDREDDDRDIDEEGRLEADTDIGAIIKKGAIGIGAGALLGALFGNVSRGLIIGSIGSAVAILAPEGEEVTLEEGTGLTVRLDRNLDLSIT